MIPVLFDNKEVCVLHKKNVNSATIYMPSKNTIVRRRLDRVTNLFGERINESILIKKDIPCDLLIDPTNYMIIKLDYSLFALSKTINYIVKNDLLTENDTDIPMSAVDWGDDTIPDLSNSDIKFIFGHYKSWYEDIHIYVSGGGITVHKNYITANKSNRALESRFNFNLKGGEIHPSAQEILDFIYDKYRKLLASKNNKNVSATEENDTD